jgi:DNA polymerase/3'-5' exonuclease PolX
MNGEHPAVQKLVHLVEATKKTIKILNDSPFNATAYPSVCAAIEKLEDALFTIDEHERV